VFVKQFEGARRDPRNSFRPSVGADWSVVVEFSRNQGHVLSGAWRG
jgi:hypothetical protein